LNLNGDVIQNEGVNIWLCVHDGNLKKKKGEEIGDEEIGMVDEILKSYSTLTVLDLSCEFEKERCLGGDEKWSKMKWITIIIIIEKTKEWLNEMKDINDNENPKER